MTGIVLFGCFALFLILGVPVAIALGAATMASILFSPDFSITTAVIPQRIFGGLESTSLIWPTRLWEASEGGCLWH